MYNNINKILNEKESPPKSNKIFHKSLKKKSHEDGIFCHIRPFYRERKYKLKKSAFAKVTRLACYNQSFCSNLSYLRQEWWITEPQQNKFIQLSVCQIEKWKLQWSFQQPESKTCRKKKIKTAFSIPEGVRGPSLAEPLSYSLDLQLWKPTECTQA